MIDLSAEAVTTETTVVLLKIKVVVVGLTVGSEESSELGPVMFVRVNWGEK